MGRLLTGSLAGAALAAAVVGSAATASPVDRQDAEASALPGKVWILATLAGKAPLRGTELTSTFTAAGRVSGSAGCNRYSGTYRASQMALRISPLATTQMACARPIERQERAFLKALTSTRSFAVRRGTLTLRSAAGRQLATFRAQTLASRPARSWASGVEPKTAKSKPESLMRQKGPRPQAPVAMRPCLHILFWWLFAQFGL